MARSPSTLPILRATAARRPALPAVQRVVIACVLVLAGLSGGGLLAFFWPPASAPAAPPAVHASNPQLVEATINKLEAQQGELKKSLADTRAQLDQLQASTAAEKAQLADVTGAIAAEKVTAGLVSLAGPGVIATFRDSTTTEIPANEDPANYILHDYNLRDIVNTLWASGAEALSINGERILATSSIYCVGTTIICNITRLSPPYEVHAIGDPDVLEMGLRQGSLMQSFLTHAAIYDEPVDIRKVQSVQVAAYSGPLTFKYARSGDSVDAPTATPAAAQP